MLNNKILEDFWNALSSISIQKVDSAIEKSNIEHYREGIVRSVNDEVEPNTAKVELAFCTLEDVPNLSGTPLGLDKKVKVFYNNKNMTGCYIGTVF